MYLGIHYSQGQLSVKLKNCEKVVPDTTNNISEGKLIGRRLGEKQLLNIKDITVKDTICQKIVTNTIHNISEED